MFNLHLSQEQLQIRDTVRDFVEREIKPVCLKAERLEALDRRLPMELLEAASQLVLRTPALSEGRGGAGADALTSCIVTEELAAGDPDLAAALAETSALGHMLFDQGMSPGQRDRFLPQFLKDHRYHLAHAAHEPGSDDSLGVNYHRPVPADAPIGTAAVPTKRRSTTRNCASRAGGASSSTRRSERSSPRSRSGSKWRAVSSGRPPGPATILKPSPTAAWPTCRFRASPRCLPRRRSTTR